MLLPAGVDGDEDDGVEEEGDAGDCDEALSSVDTDDDDADDNANTCERADPVDADASDD